VIDTDCIAHELVEPGQPALRRIEQELGREFLDEAGGLDRRKMREAIFADRDLKKRLESILHPLIAAEVLRRIEQSGAPYCILVIPLFAESARWPWIDRVLAIDAPESTQIERVMERDGIDLRQAQAILNAQSSRAQRLALADDIINNSGTLDELREEVEALHHRYLSLAKPP
jgi:dephospho-CoA kinase